MTVKELIEHLKTLPEDQQDLEIRYQGTGKTVLDYSIDGTLILEKENTPLSILIY